MVGVEPAWAWGVPAVSGAGDGRGPRGAGAGVVSAGPGVVSAGCDYSPRRQTSRAERMAGSSQVSKRLRASGTESRKFTWNGSRDTT